MRPFTTETSHVIPLMQPDIDTDQIIPAQFVNARGRDALARALFANRRAEEAGFVLNDPAMAGRSMMLVGSNFGCGSSREAAAWALDAFGIHALIGTTFNETFASNCLQNAILTVALSPDAHGRVAAALRAQDAPLTIDLGRCCLVLADGSAIDFTMDAFAQEMLVHGHDELDYLLARRPLIARYEAERAAAGAAA